MKKYAKIAILPIAMMLASLVGCSKSVPITVTIINRHNLPVEGVELSLNGKSYVTNYKGSAVLKNASAIGTVEFKSLPDGYSKIESFKLDGMTDYTIVLESELISKPLERGTTIGIGNIAYDYSFMTLEKTEDGKVQKELITLKDKLRTNDCLILNFWYIDCSACDMEAPCITKAYAPHKDNGAYMLGVDYYDKKDGTDELLCQAKEDKGFNFDIAYDYDNMTGGYGVTSFPTTAIIDRYGFICFLMNGQILDSQEFSNLIDSFTGDDYEPVFYKKNSFEIQQ